MNAQSPGPLRRGVQLKACRYKFWTVNFTVATLSLELGYVFKSLCQY